ncbi:MAG: hypothetical protein WC696_08305 [Candidatus Methylopumilus sp.]|jgi:hypothetical protein
MERELSVLENAFDSLNESFRQYRLGELTSVNLKFSVMLFAHFVELAQIHLLQATGAPRGKRPGFANDTKILSSSGERVMPADLAESIDSLRKKRNEMQHNRVTYKPFEVRILISTVLTSFYAYARGFEVELKDGVDKENLQLFSHLTNPKVAFLAIAQDKALAVSDNGVSYGCYECGENRVASKHEDKITCHNCLHVHSLNT